MERADLSGRIEFLRFLLIAGLVFLHYDSFPDSDASPFRGYAAGAMPGAMLVNSYVLFFFFSAVPLLSAISGYLFFGGADFSARFYARRWRRRLRTIALPMVAWNAITIGLFLAILAAMPDSPLLLILRYDVAALGLTETVNALFGITRHPVNFQFWFLRDLIVTIAVSPVLGLMLSRAPWAGLALLGAVWITGFDLWVFFRTDVLFFFYVGAMARLRGWRLEMPPGTAAALMALYAVLVGVRTVAPTLLPDGGLAESLLAPATRLLRILGVAAFWGCAAYLAASAAGRWIAGLSGAAFFLYALHWPLNQFIKAGLAALVPTGTNAGLLFNYFATSLLTVAAGVLAARFLANAAPSVHALLSGGRDGPGPRPSGPGSDTGGRVRA